MYSPTDCILITVDSLRFDYVYETNGDVHDSLPTIEKFVRSGVDFTNAFSNAAYTAQSFRAILGGTYPWMFGDDPEGFEPDRPHLAELLSTAGYTTAGFYSNPHLEPVFGYDRGFDQYMGRDGEGETTTAAKLRTAITNHVSPTSPVFRGIHWLHQTAGSALGLQLGGKPYVPAEQLNDQVLEWVASTSPPRFLWIHYMDVHNPYYPHEGTVSEGISQRRAIRLFHRTNKHPERVTDEEVDRLKTLYRGELEYLDRCLQELLDGLERHVDLDDSLVAFTSDHGEGFGEHGFFFHPGAVLYDELTHVPLAVRGPGFEPETVTTPVSTVDLVPTFVPDEYSPNVCAGTDLRRVVDEPPDDRRVFAEAQSQMTGKSMVCTGTWKLVSDYETDTDYLFNRDVDPGETRNRSTGDEPVYEELETALNEHVETVRAHSVGETVERTVSSDVEDRLRRLGYHD